MLGILQCTESKEKLEYSDKAKKAVSENRPPLHSLDHD